MKALMYKQTALSAFVAVALAGCSLAPDYKRPDAPVSGNWPDQPKCSTAPTPSRPRWARSRRPRWSRRPARRPPTSAGASSSAIAPAAPDRAVAGQQPRPARGRAARRRGARAVRRAARRAVAQHRRRHPGPAPAPARQHAGAGRWLDQQQLPGRHRPDHVRDRPVRPVAQPVRGGVPAVPVDRAGAEERAHHAGGLGRAGLFQPARGRGPDGPDPAHAGLAPGVLQPGQAPLRRRCVVRAGLESGQDLAGFGLVQPGRAGPRARKAVNALVVLVGAPCPRTCPRRPRSAASNCWPRCRRGCRPTCWSAGPTSSPPSTSSESANANIGAARAAFFPTIS